ncbi:MAG: CinA family nicotinamide mononucleotide deamidase-related protein [Planctomycetota bacterium]
MKRELIIVSVGEEILAGDILDSNAAEIAAAARAEGFLAQSIVTVGDRVDRISDALRRAARAAPLVVVTGGLGPTADDLTRAGLAKAAEQDLVEDPAALEMIRGHFERIGLPMSESNKLQAWRPSGARLIRNPRGTAPGLEQDLFGSLLFVLPGVPAEMRGMLEGHVIPRIREVLGGEPPLPCIKVRAHGLPESLVGEKIADLMRPDLDPILGVTVSSGVLTVSITSINGDREEGMRRVRRCAGEVERRLGPACFGRDVDQLQGVLVRLLKTSRRTLAIAESCTGGLASHLVTQVPGASEVFLEGVVTYSNEAKTRRLEVKEELLLRHGAVSPEVAAAMAAGVARTSGAALGLSTTGIAGPTGATPGKPVGLVYLGVCLDGVTETRKVILSGDREMVQLRAARSALDLGRRALLKNSGAACATPAGPV